SDLTAAGHRVAVLAVDPSSTRSGGSILGDKTRMTRLAADPAAFIRPSPTGGTLGGVAKTTREAIVVVEAAGYDVVIVETVGVGQSETTVAGMVDTFLFLTLARTGDQLQGIKKGILEVADVIAVNKADGPHADDARRAARDLAGALRMMDSAAPVLTCSALENTGVAEIWKQLSAHRSQTDITARRRSQQVDWTFAMARETVLRRFENDPAVRSESVNVRELVRDGSLTPAQGARRLLDAYDNIC
ncbi:MAG TPA: methylmalonyl Co-A mutase-associated GTPase MeaB, partial [Actinoplanes sp.]|nr:methylmalonyl Co-A mutase-associated GTPase MeaB [Actinoplanes sp.]